MGTRAKYYRSEPFVWSKSTTKKICSGICGKLVPSHVTPSTCMYCNKIPQNKKCEGICGRQVPIHVIPEKCHHCAKTFICPGVCKETRYGNRWSPCDKCHRIQHPIGTCKNGCINVELYGSFCKDCKQTNKVESRCAAYGDIIEGHRVLVTVINPRSGDSYDSHYFTSSRYNYRKGDGYNDVDVYNFPCLKHILDKPKKISVYNFSKIKLNHPDNYYCSGTDEFTTDSIVYKNIVNDEVMAILSDMDSRDFCKLLKFCHQEKKIIIDIITVKSFTKSDGDVFYDSYSTHISDHDSDSNSTDSTDSCDFDETLEINCDWTEMSMYDIFG